MVICRSIHINILGALLLVAIIFCLLPGQIFAQSQETGVANVEIRLGQALTDAQTISLATLGINTSGRGTQLFELIVENLTDEVQEDLFLRIEVSSSRRGVLAALYTHQDRPFRLQPRQLGVATNNNLAGGIPGLPGTSLQAELTSNGRNFLTDLAGSPSLPDAVYSVQIYLFRGGNSLSTGTLLSTASDNIGSRPIQNVVDYLLLQPGGPIGLGDIAPGRNPVFRWEGPQDQRYRLIVVEDRGQSPFSLIQGALSTEPTTGPGATGSRLLEYEMLDAIVQGTTFQYPASGVPPLQEGRRYFWQLFAKIPTATGVDLRPSTIFEFTIPSTSVSAEVNMAREEAIPVVTEISPQVAARLQQFVNSGYEIVSIEIDGQTYTGVQMLNMLEAFNEKVRDGKIILVNQ